MSSTAASPATAPLTVLRRADYAPVGFTITTVSLSFSIDVHVAGTTRVEASLELSQTPAGAAGSVPRTVRLHRALGVAQDILSMELDGRLLQPQTDYTEDSKFICIEPPVGASAWREAHAPGRTCAPPLHTSDGIPHRHLRHTAGSSNPENKLVWVGS